MNVLASAASAAQRVAGAGLAIRASRSVRMARARASCLIASERRPEDAAHRGSRASGLADRRSWRVTLDPLDRMHALD